MFELAGSFNIPVMDAKGEMKDYFRFQNFGTVNGIGFHLNIKYNFKKNSHLLPYLTVGFAQLQNDDNQIAYIDSNNITTYPLYNSEIYSPTSGNSLLVFRDFNIGTGLHYSASTRNTLIPFIGLEINYHRIWGAYIQEPRIPSGQNSNEHKTFDIKPVSRLGLSADAGMDYRINKYLGFVFGTKFQISNFVGKNSERTNPNENYRITFLDKENTSLNSNLNKSRNFAYFEFYIGFVVFTGTF